MPSPIENGESTKPGAETIALCLILVCSLQIMENLLPKIPIFPWLRIGLAYWVLLPFLIRFGVLQAAALFLFRNLITLLYGGQIFSAFLISTSAGVATFMVAGAGLRWLYLNQKIGLIGCGVLMAAVFNSVQLVVVNQLLVQHYDFYYQLPPILLWSVISGSLVALLVVKSERGMTKLLTTAPALPEPVRNGSGAVSPLEVILLCAGASVLVLLFTVDLLTVQLAFIPILLLLNRFRNLKVLFFAWPYYFYIAILHLFRTEGVFILGEWITREGLHAFLFYSARTTNVILCGQWMAGFIPALVRNSSRNRYLKGFGYALPVLPAIFGISITLGRDLLRSIRRRELDHLLDPVIQRLLEEFRNLENTTGDERTNTRNA